MWKPIHTHEQDGHLNTFRPPENTLAIGKRSRLELEEKTKGPLVWHHRQTAIDSERTASVILEGSPRYQREQFYVVSLVDRYSQPVVSPLSVCRSADIPQVIRRKSGRTWEDQAIVSVVVTQDSAIWAFRRTIRPINLCRNWSPIVVRFWTGTWCFKDCFKAPRICKMEICGTY